MVLGGDRISRKRGSDVRNDEEVRLTKLDNQYVTWGGEGEGRAPLIFPLTEGLQVKVRGPLLEYTLQGILIWTAWPLRFHSAVNLPLI